MAMVNPYQLIGTGPRCPIGFQLISTLIIPVLLSLLNTSARSHLRTRKRIGQVRSFDESADVPFSGPRLVPLCQCCSQFITIATHVAHVLVQFAQPGAN